MADQKKARKLVSLTLEGAAIDVALNLVADLILPNDSMEKSRVEQQGGMKIEPFMFPDDHGFARDVLRTIYSFTSDSIQPTEHNILRALSMAYEDAPSRMALLLSYRSPKPSVAALSLSLADAIGQRRIQGALTEALKLAQRGSGLSNYALYEQISQLISAVAPRQKSVQSQLASSLDDDFWPEYDRLYELNKSGIAVGPVFPWGNLRKIVPWLNKGDLTLWMAPTKSYKSVVAQMIADHVAYNMTGYNVALYHLETSPHQMWKRRYCRRLPMHVMDMYNVDRNSPAIAKRIKQLREEIRHAEKDCGEMWYHFCPNIGFNEFKGKVLNDKARAESQGRELLVIIDYYQKFDWTQFSTQENHGLNAIAHHLKGLIQENDLFGVTFAQDHFTESKDKFNDPSAAGASTISQVSQVLIRTIRDPKPAPVDHKLVDSKGNPLRDILGKEMYAHHAGKQESAMSFHVIRANENEGGAGADVRACGGFYNILDRHPVQL